MTGAISTLFHYRELLAAWTMRIIRARYQQSILGGFWAILQPVATAAIFTTVFSYFLKVDTGKIPYVIFAYSALVPWMMFSSSITDMSDAIVSNMNLVAKIFFPREILVIAALLARLMDFLIAYILLIVLMIANNLPVFQFSWIYLPLLLLIQLMLALGLGLILSSMNAFYRDVRHLVVLLLQLWLYATPIIYPITLVPDSIRPYYFLNPMAGVIQGYRSVLFNASPPDSTILLSVAVSLVVLVTGYLVFKRVEHRFADII